MGPKEPVTFLGVETSEVPRVLSEQMGLPRGFGVVVDYVVPNGPAAAAGLQASDIIRMLNDQQIVDPSQLGKLVRSFAEGTSVDLTLLRKGKEVKVSVKLGKKDVPVGHGPFGFEQEWNFDDLDKMKFDFKAPDMSAVREAVARAKDQAMRARDEAQRAVRGLRIVTTDDGLTKSTRIDLGKATITFSDDQGELKMESVEGRKMLTAKDAQGKVLYNGPIDTEEERAKLPANVRQRFEKLERQELPKVPAAPNPRKLLALPNRRNRRACSTCAPSAPRLRLTIAAAGSAARLSCKRSSLQHTCRRVALRSAVDGVAGIKTRTPRCGHFRARGKAQPLLRVGYGQNETSTVRKRLATVALAPTISCARPAAAHDDARAKTLRASADGRENAHIARSVRSLSLPRFCLFCPRKLRLDRRSPDADDRDRVGSLRAHPFGYGARPGRARRRGPNHRAFASGRTSCGSFQPQVDHPVFASRERVMLGLPGAHFLESPGHSTNSRRRE